jgi:hypothetical protein
MARIVRCKRFNGKIAGDIIAELFARVLHLRHKTPAADLVEVRSPQAGRRPATFSPRKSKYPATRRTASVGREA